MLTYNSSNIATGRTTAQNLNGNHRTKVSKGSKVSRDL